MILEIIDIKRRNCDIKVLVVHLDRALYRPVDIDVATDVDSVGFSEQVAVLRCNPQPDVLSLLIQVNERWVCVPAFKRALEHRLVLRRVSPD